MPQSSGLFTRRYPAFHRGPATPVPVAGNTGLQGLYLSVGDDFDLRLDFVDLSDHEEITLEDDDVDSISAKLDKNADLEDLLHSMHIEDDNADAVWVTNQESEPVKNFQDGRGGLAKNQSVHRSSLKKKASSKHVTSKKTTILKDPYIVQRIVDYKVVKAVDTFRVRWEGYSADEDTWEPAKHLTSSPANILLIATYFYNAQMLKLSHSYLVEYLKQTILGTHCHDDLLLSRLSGVPLDPKGVPVSASEKCRMQAIVLMDLTFAKRASLLSQFNGDFRNFVCFLQTRAALLDDLLQWEALIGKCEVNAKITIENTVNEASLPTDFKYIQNHIISPNIRLTPVTQSCACPTESCLGEKCCGTYKMRYRYYTKNKTLSKYCTKLPLYECNHLCSCGPECLNRVVQHGIQLSLTIFMTSARGWGVRTNKKISRGAFVAEYIGELITVAEADAKNRSDSVYMFDLKPYKDRPTANVIDGTRYGNVARFFNHSCEPNLAASYVYIEHHNLDAPRVAFFARRNIAANEELTFNYNTDGSEGSSGKIKCRCGSKKCIEYIY